MMIETRGNRLLEQTILGDTPPDSAWIESQIGVLKSQNVASYVVKQLRLADSPDFAGPAPSLLDKALARFGRAPVEPKTEQERAGEATGAVMGGLDVRRVGQSYMLKIDFHSPNPELAAKVANTMIDAYIFDQLNAKYQANRRAGDWLQERLQTLREQASAAERAVIEFKSKNNIVTAGGALISDRQLSDINAQVASVRAQAMDVQSRLERVAAVRRAYQEDQPSSLADENVSEAMNNPIITGLRTKYLDLVNREADFSTRYGRNHIAVVNLRNQIRDLRRSIRDELGRIEETLKSEFAIAQKRRDDLEKTLASQVSQSTATNQAQVALFSLEASAQSYRKLYDSFLQRHTEAVQQQSFPITEARAISPASVVKTGPQSGRIWLLTVLAGGLAGIGFGALREILDRGFRTREQVRSVLATDCLALVPRLEGRNSRRRVGAQRPGGILPAFITDRIGGRDVYISAEIWRALHNSPDSPYAQAIRTIKLTLDLNDATGKSSKIVGLTSSLPSEGKSTIAGAMAMLIAQSGGRVILVDCDVRNPSLSRALAPDAKVGLVEAISKTVAFDDAVWRDAKTGMAFLPAIIREPCGNLSELLASDAAKSFFESLREKYDYVIVDLPPLVAAIDVRATSRFVSSYVLIIEWGQTKVDAVQYALRNLPQIQENVVGAVLNKVDMAAMGRYDSYGAHYYGYGRRIAH